MPFLRNKIFTPTLAFFVVIVLVLTSTGILEAAAPTVITIPASSISKTGATIAGLVTDDGGEIVTDSGFEFGLTTSYGQTVAGQEKYLQVASFGTEGSVDNLNLDDPRGIDVDSSDNVYVADSGNSRIKKFNSDLDFISAFGVTGAGDGEFDAPADVTVMPSGNMWVIDTGNLSFVELDSTGAFVDCYGLGATCSVARNYSGTPGLGGGISAGSVDAEIYFVLNHAIGGYDAVGTSVLNVGGQGTADGQYNAPKGIFANATDDLFIADSTNNRVQKVDSSGAFLMRIGPSNGASGSGEGQFNNPLDVIEDINGDIFVTDNQNHRVQKFSSTGTFISEFGGFGTADDQLSSPHGIASDSNGDVYVVDKGNDRVVKYTRGFEADLTVVLPSLTCGTTYHYRAYATNADGTSYGADETFTTLDCDTPVVRTVGATNVTADSVTLTGLHEGHGSFSLSSRGFEYGTSVSYGTSDTDAGSLFKDEFGGSGGGGGGGTFIALNTAGTDVDGNIFTTDQFEDIIQRFTSAGAHSADYNVSFPAPGGVTTPSVVRGGPDGRVYAVDASNSQIVRFDDETFANPTVFAAGAGLSGPTDIGFDSTGNVYIVDSGNNRVIKYDSTGTTLLLEIDAGFGGAPLSTPISVAIDSAGSIYVSDTGNVLVQKFNSSGAFVDSVGSTGDGDAEFGGAPGYLAINSDDYLFVSDSTNNRVMKFDSDLVFLSSFGISGSGDGEFSSPYGVAIGTNEDIVISDNGNSRIQVFNEYFTASITGLSCGTTYHYQAIATNGDGTGEGGDATFTTSACPDAPPSPSGGGSNGTKIVCVDPKALNYTSEIGNARINNDICRYPEPGNENQLSCSTDLYLTKPVKYGAANNPVDVKLLEKYLNTYEGYNLPVDGVYSLADFNAVVVWQEKYSKEILAPWGIQKGTGYVFITSLRKIRLIHEGECDRVGATYASESCYLYDQTLRRGDNNNFVKFAQKALKAVGTLAGSADGVFGPMTENAVKEFQKSKGLNSDGVIGYTTGTELGKIKCDI